MEAHENANCGDGIAKRGVGKSSVCMHLCGVLSQSGYRTLIVDGDPQASISASHLGYNATRALEPEHTIYAIHAGLIPYPEQVIRPTAFPGIDLLPGHRAAARFNTPEPHLSTVGDQIRLREFLHLSLIHI